MTLHLHACNPLSLSHTHTNTHTHTSFHVGSGCQTPSAYQEALAMCLEMFEYGASIGYYFTLLDIGGGYPGEKGSEELFRKVASAINQALGQQFSLSKYSNLDIIAEPG